MATSEPKGGGRQREDTGYELTDIDSVLRYLVQAPGFAEERPVGQLVQDAETCGLVRRLGWALDEKRIPPYFEFHRELVVDSHLLVVRGTTFGCTRLSGTDDGHIVTECTGYLLYGDEHVRPLMLEISPEPFEHIWLPPIFMPDGTYRVEYCGEVLYGATVEIVDLILDAMWLVSQGQHRSWWSRHTCLLRVWLETHLLLEGRLPKKIASLPPAGRQEWSSELLDAARVEAESVFRQPVTTGGLMMAAFGEEWPCCPQP